MLLHSFSTHSTSSARSLIALAVLVALASLVLSRLASSVLARQSPSRLVRMSTATAGKPLKNVIVIGGSYVGLMAAKELIELLNPDTHRVVVVDKNSHFGHLFAYPRFAISPGHEHKAFIPFHPMLLAPHAIIQAEAIGFEPATGGGKVLLDRDVVVEGWRGREVEYEAAVVATGTKLSKPGTLDTEKKDSITYLQSVQSKLKNAQNIVIIGGGAVGVQMATDLSILYPSSNKSITVIQSRRLMPRFHPKLHEIVQARFDELGVRTLSNVRAKIPEGGYEKLNEAGGGEVELENGRRVKANYVIHALGQTPNSALLTSSLPSTILASGFLRVTPSLLLDPSDSTETERLDGRVWALGDIAESGAPKAARPAMQQAQIVARNLVKRLKGEREDSYETFTPSPGAIHLTLGVVESIIFRNPASHVDAQTGEVCWDGEPEFFWKDDGREDMGIESVWERRVPGFVVGDIEKYHL